MNDKKQIMTMVDEELGRWEALLASLSEAQITAPHLADGWSIKDVIAHLRAWQQRSVARLDAALSKHDPAFPAWPAGLDPESEDVQQLNAWIYQTAQDQPWATVYREWRAGFLRFLELGRAIPEPDLLAPGKYPWLEGHPLSLVLVASYEHHAEHRDQLRAWLREHGPAPIAG